MYLFLPTVRIAAGGAFSPTWRYLSSPFGASYLV